MNHKGNTGFTTYLVAGVSVGALCAIALMSLYGDLSAPTPPSPEQFVESQPTAALPVPGAVEVAPPAQAAAPLPTETLSAAPVVAVTPSSDAASAVVPPAPPPVVADNGASSRDELLRMLEDWRKAWANRDVEAYFSFYAADYAGNTDSPAAWQASRRRVIDQAGLIDISFGEATIEMDGKERATLTFPMNYRSKRFEDEGVKQLQLVRDQGKWRITREQFTAN
ncbi:hypothetical protein [Azonexus sp.]|uniref:YybH family protein n=1 Tax=Azonexus sp. TaxID=1872668 RepID=UPI0035AE0B7D